ncbi:MAG: hypothetical protein ACLFPQ_05740 [Candidatus Woesearchaeota archaeon]
MSKSYNITVFGPTPKETTDKFEKMVAEYNERLESTNNSTLGKPKKIEYGIQVMGDDVSSKLISDEGFEALETELNALGDVTVSSYEISSTYSITKKQQKAVEKKRSSPSSGDEKVRLSIDDRMRF